MKKDVIYSSSRDALDKIFVLLLTFGISIFTSVFDTKSCYAVILVQAINNMYDFYQYTDNKKYVTKIKREAIAVVVTAIIAIILSIVAFFEEYVAIERLVTKLIAIFLVTLPLIFIYNDYRTNVFNENESEV